MMNELEKVARQALEALEYPGPSWIESRQAAAVALRRALEQPAQQEPVAWVKSNGELVVRTDYGGRLYYSEQNLYTHPPAQQKPFGYLKLSTAKFVYEVEGTNPMSDKSYLPLYTGPQARECVGLTNQELLYTFLSCATPQDGLRAIEAKLREKNT